MTNLHHLWRNCITKTKGWYNSVKSAVLGDVILSLFSTAHCEINNECSHQAGLEINSVDLWNHKSQRSTALGPQRLDIKHTKQQHFAKHIFCMFTKSPFSWYPLLGAVIYIDIAVNIYENSIKWKEIFTRLLSIAFPLVCNEDVSCMERFVNMTKLHHMTNLHHHTLSMLV